MPNFIPDCKSSILGLVNDVSFFMKIKNLLIKICVGGLICSSLYTYLNQQRKDQFQGADSTWLDLYVQLLPKLYLFGAKF